MERRPGKLQELASSPEEPWMKSWSRTQAARSRIGSTSMLSKRSQAGGKRICQRKSGFKRKRTTSGLASAQSTKSGTEDTRTDVLRPHLRRRCCSNCFKAAALTTCFGRRSKETAVGVGGSLRVKLPKGTKDPIIRYSGVG